MPLLDGMVCPSLGSATLASCHCKGYGEISCDPEYFVQVHCNEYGRSKSLQHIFKL